MPVEHEYYYTPWEKDLIEIFGTAENEIIIVCPFIKTSIIKKIISKVAYKDIKITLVTRFNKQLFSQKSSDIDVIDIFLNCDAIKNPPRLYKLNRVHAKLFIIDRKCMFITSSNLSFSGLNSNYEIGIKVTNKHDIDKVYWDILRLCKTLPVIDNHELHGMRNDLNLMQRLSFSNLDFHIDPEEIDNVNISDVLTSKVVENEELETLLSISDNEKKSIISINKYLIDSKTKKYNSVSGYDFISTQEFVDDTEYSETSKKTINAHAIEDYEKLRCSVEELMVNYIGKSNIDNMLNIFMHKSWLNCFMIDKLDQEYLFFFKNIGKYVHSLFILEKLLRRRFFSGDNVGYYSMVSNYIMDNYPYYEILEKIGLNCALIKGEITSSFDRDHFRAILGYLYVFSKNDVVKRMYEKFMSREDSYMYDSIDVELNYKTTLQTYTQKKYRSIPAYRKVQSSGSQHNPKFTVECAIKSKILSTGVGKSIKAAEMDAAKNYLSYINVDLGITSQKKEGSLYLKKYSISNERVIQLEQLVTEWPIFGGDLNLLDISLTHRSVVNEDRSLRSCEKLSLLGSFVDRLILFLISIDINGHTINKELCEKTGLLLSYSPIPVYSMIFDHYKLEKYVKICKNLSITDRIKSEFVQSLVGYLYLKGGMHESISLIKDSWINISNNVKEKIVHPLSKMQEDIERGPKLPWKVDIVELRGGEKASYRASIVIDGIGYGIGIGSSKKKAKFNAAEKVLQNPEYLELVSHHSSESKIK